MTLLIGALNVDDFANGYRFRIIYGDRITGVAEVSGQRVLIPGREGYYTTSDAFEARHLLVGLKGIVQGAGSTHAAIQTSLATRYAALRTACDLANRQDVTITDDDWTINAGFLRFEGPSLIETDGEAMLDMVIEFDATDPPNWEAS